jgi:hypothetical protein
MEMWSQAMQQVSGEVSFSVTEFLSSLPCWMHAIVLERKL